MTSGRPQRLGTSTACYRRRISSARQGALLFNSIGVPDTQGFQLGRSLPAPNRSRFFASLRPRNCTDRLVHFEVIWTCLSPFFPLESYLLLCGFWGAGQNFTRFVSGCGIPSQGFPCEERDVSNSTLDHQNVEGGVEVLIDEFIGYHRLIEYHVR